MWISLARFRKSGRGACHWQAKSLIYSGMKYLVTYLLPIAGSSNTYHGDQQQIVVDADSVQHAKDEASNHRGGIHVKDAIPLPTLEEIAEYLRATRRQVSEDAPEL